MQVEQTEVIITTLDGQMPAVLVLPDLPGQKPAILLLMEAFGLTTHLRAVAQRLAIEGYIVLIPDLYYRELPHNKFGYDEVESAMSMMARLDLGKPMAADIGAALAYVKAHAAVASDRIGVTGFCLGGGLTFFTACEFSSEIAAAAPFYGMVLDQWIAAVPAITVPIYLCFGGRDPFIPLDRIQQIQARFQELDKDYTLKVYPDAGHGFFCDQRSDYHAPAAAAAWHELTQFFQQHLQRRGSLPEIR